MFIQQKGTTSLLHCASLP